MNPALQQLKDIHLPQPISMWPTTPGWILLFIIIAVLLAYGTYYWFKKRRRAHPIHHALRQLNQLQTLLNHNPDNINIAAEISTLIRRTALCYFQRDVIAGLSDQAWLDFLNQSGDTTQFTGTVGQLLIDAPYRKNNTTDLAPLFSLTENWLSTLAKQKEKK